MMNGCDRMTNIMSPVIAVVLLIATGQVWADDLTTWTAADWPAGDVAVALETEEGSLSVEMYAGGRHRAVAQHLTVPRPTEVTSIAFLVPRARSGVGEAQLAVSLREVPGGLAPQDAVEAGRVLREAVTRLPSQVADGSVIGFTFEPVTLRPGRAYVWRMQFVEPAPLRSLGLSAGRFRGRRGPGDLLGRPQAVAASHRAELRRAALRRSRPGGGHAGAPAPRGPAGPADVAAGRALGCDRR